MDDEAVREKVAKFLERHSNQPESASRITNLIRYLDGRPDYLEPLDLVPRDEIEQRLLEIEKILSEQRKMRPNPEWHFTSLQISVLMMMPLSALQARPRDDFVLRLNLDHLEPIFDFFLRPAKETPTDSWTTPQNNGKKRAISGPSAPKIRSNPGSPGHCDKYRDKDEREKCYDQDHEHWNNTTHRHLQTTKIATALTLISPGNQCLYRLHADVGSSDKAWNMIALSPLLHSWWSKGYFAFKYVGTTPVKDHDNLSEITLQFRWMPRSPNPNGTRMIKLEDQRDPKKSLLDGLTHYYGDDISPPCGAECPDCQHTAHVGIHSLETNHRICSGDLIRVRRDTQFAFEFKSMIELQWGFICAAALSGAARAPEFLRRLEDDEDEEGEDAAKRRINK
ncbi:hypothetical protein G7Z17_g5409 [Cylindrodendrum hubeiense]|uniref:HNH nuclease domain-containing protein n=1 Tax=Cylindrodendrum hubeiense TaxID=595255 RepID=A0A9P5HAY8_9HYPO|nr:hypothetical protein G7Z17_g5409 [Cylindrodendrum hubeiense]